MNKDLKNAILIINYGSDYAETKAKSTDMIYKEIVERYPEFPVYEAFTNTRVVSLPEEMRRAGNYNLVEEAMDKMAEDGIEAVYCVMTFLVPVDEYYKALNVLKRYEPKFSLIKVTYPAMYELADCRRVAMAMIDSAKFDHDKAYILLGHGTANIADVLWEQIEEEIHSAGYDKVFLALLRGAPALPEAIGKLQNLRYDGEVTIVPIMVGAGYSVRSTLEVSTNPFLMRLRTAGFPVKTIIKGVGEYPEFREVFYEKLDKIMNED